MNNKTKLAVYQKKARTFVNGLSHHLAIRSLKLISKSHPELATKKIEQFFTTTQRHRRNIFETSILLWADDHTFQVSGKQVKVWTWGSGPPVLFVHGWSGRGTQFYKWVDHYLEAGYQVITFDAPGHGHSEGNRSALPLFVETILEIGRTFGPLEGIIGHSMGGIAALAAMARGLDAKRSIIIGTPAQMKPSMESNLQHKLGLNPGMIANLFHRLEQRFSISLDQLESKVSIQNIGQPILIWHDLDDDEVSLESAKLLASLSPQAELRITKGYGHYRILRHQELIQDSLNFLKGESYINQGSLLASLVFEH